jgi:hypothetical protein
MSKYFKLFKATPKMGSSHVEHLKRFSYVAEQGRILKRGTIAMVAATVGAGAGALMSNDRPSERSKDLKKSALTGALLAGGVTAAVLARRPIGNVASDVGAGVREGAKVFFRRIRGRIVPIKVK